MLQKKSIVIGAALAGLSAGMLTATTNASADEVHCWGMNKCGKDSKAKDKANCAVDAKQIAAANAAFPNKFSNAEVHKCGEHAKCAAEKGNLNWTKVKSKEECKKLSGFLINKKGEVEKL